MVNARDGGVNVIGRIAPETVRGCNRQGKFYSLGIAARWKTLLTSRVRYLRGDTISGDAVAGRKFRAIRFRALPAARRFVLAAQNAGQRSRERAGGLRSERGCRGITSVQTTGTLTVRLLPSTALTAAAAAWQAIEARNGPVGLACSWAWTATWVDAYGDLVPHWFAVGDGPAGPLGAALVTQGVGARRAGIGIRTLHIGTAGEPDADTVVVESNRLLSAERDRAGFAEALHAVLRDSEIAWDEWALDGFEPEHVEPFLKLAGNFTVRADECPTVDLAQARSESRAVLKILDPGVAKKIGRSRRKLERDFGPLAIAWADDAVIAGQWLDEMIPLHAARWERAGQAGAFASPRFSRFHRALIARLLPTGQVFLLRATAGETLVGVLYGFNDNGCALFYQWGLGQFASGTISPGYVAGSMAMQAALDRGFSEWNWLAGEAAYKRDLSTGSRPLIWARGGGGGEIPTPPPPSPRLAPAKKRGE
ncbi:MAG: GNAT family N-acetyltransferase, partial [Thermomicrobiales bacterium]